MAKGKKKKSRRDSVKYPDFDPIYVPKIRREYMEIDYLNKLSDEEKEWLHKFEKEFNGASLDFKDLSNNIHNTPKLKKNCTDTVNARNRCMYGIAKANKLISDDKVNSIVYSNHEFVEDAMIDHIDNKDDDDEY